MKGYTEINLEYNHPACDAAMDELRQALKTTRSSKIGCITFIHGYGSSGKVPDANLSWTHFERQIAVDTASKPLHSRLRLMPQAFPCLNLQFAR